MLLFSESNLASLCIIGEYLLTFDSIKRDLSSANIFCHEKIRNFNWENTIYFLYFLHLQHSIVLLFVAFKSNLTSLCIIGEYLLTFHTMHAMENLEIF